MHKNGTVHRLGSTREKYFWRAWQHDREETISAIPWWSFRLNPLGEEIWAHLWSRLTRCSASSKLRLCLSNCLPTSPLKYILSFSHTHLLVHILWEKMCINYAHLCASSNVWSGNLDRWALLQMCRLHKSSVTLYWQRCWEQVRRKKPGPILTSPGLFYVCTRAEVFGYPIGYL